MRIAEHITTENCLEYLHAQQKNAEKVETGEWTEEELKLLFSHLIESLFGWSITCENLKRVVAYLEEKGIEIPDAKNLKAQNKMSQEVSRETAQKILLIAEEFFGISSEEVKNIVKGVSSA